MSVVLKEYWYQSNTVPAAVSSLIVMQAATVLIREGA
jgi:hypothetical protein